MQHLLPPIAEETIRIKIRKHDHYSVLTQEQRSQLTVPLMDTMMVPVTEPNRSPADMVNGIAGIARI